MHVIKPRKRTILTTALGLLCLIFLLGFTELPWILSKPLIIQENINEAPVIVALYSGYGKIVRNGLDKYSLARVQKAVQLWKRGLASYILFSGGGADRREGGAAGAEKMALEAIKQSIPQERIIIEQDSRDTRQNAINSSHILKQKGWNNVILITNDFHMQRAVRLFEKENVHVYPAPIEWQVRGAWKSNWEYLRFLRYELQARVAYLLLTEKQIDALIDFLRPTKDFNQK
jgi:uncharacterized SAM-binding protein YcdF (DUF218 family)